MTSRCFARDVYHSNAVFMLLLCSRIIAHIWAPPFCFCRIVHIGRIIVDVNKMLTSSFEHNHADIITGDDIY